MLDVFGQKSQLLIALPEPFHRVSMQISLTCIACVSRMGILHFLETVNQFVQVYLSFVVARRMIAARHNAAV